MEDESERKSKLQAGKEALLAYQKKKAKKSKKKPTEYEESSDNSRSEPTSSSDISTALHVQADTNVSPLPWSESSAASLEMSAASMSYPLGFSPDISLVGMVPAIDHVALESSIGLTSKDADRLVRKVDKQEQESIFDLTFDSDRPSQTKIDVQTKEAVDLNQQQVLELRKHLLDSETECRALNAQLAELSLKHKGEVESAMYQQKAAHDLVVQEHVAHIARLSAELASSQLHEQDEGEAMRIKLLKEQLKSMYDKEINTLQLEHSREKERLSKDYLQQQENFKKNMEEQANSEIQKIHSEYRVAYEQVLAERSTFESEASEFKTKYSTMEQRLEDILHQKESLEEKYTLLSQMHSDEISKMQQAARVAEESISSWKQKSTALEAKVNEFETERQQLCCNIDQLKRAQLDTQAELSESKALVEHYQLEVEELKNEHEIHLQQLEEQHQAEKEEMQGKLTNQLTSLEDSLSEASGDKASLEVAEVHMKNLEKQLREYRLQEQSFQNKLRELEQEHIADAQAIRLHCETEKAEDIEKVTAEFEKQIEALEEQLSSLQKVVQSSHSVDYKHDIDLLKADHDRIIGELRRTFEETQRVACNEQQCAHDKELEALGLQHAKEIATVKIEMQANVEAVKQELKKKVEEKEVEIQSLKQKHSANIQKLRESLLESEDSPLAVSEGRVAKLEEELDEQRNEWQAENQDLMAQLEFAQRNLEEAKENLRACGEDKRQLTEQLVRCEEAVRTLKVDLSIAGNTADEQRYTAESTKQQLLQCKQELDEVNAAAKSKEQKIAQLCQEIADNQNVISDLLGQCATLKEEVRQVSQGAHEVALQLGLVKDECSRHSDRYAATDAELLQVRADLDASHRELAASRQAHETAVAALLKDMEALKPTAADGHHQKQQDEDRIQQLNDSISDLQKALDAVLTENAALKQASSRKDPHGAEEELELVCKERDELLVKIEQLENSQAVSEDKQNRCELKVLEQEQQIQALLEQLNTREAAFTELQKEFRRQLAGAGSRESGPNQAAVGLANDKVCIEESLSTAREALTEKLKEKADLERNLNFHRTELERRLAEKQRLEELLFEKSRFEQELQSQKDQLQSELREIESRLRLKESELERRHSEWKSSLETKDGIIQQKDDEIAKKVHEYEKEVQQKQKSINELDRLHGQLVQKHSVELKDLSYHHSQDLEALQVHLSQRHQDSLLSLEERHKKELEELREQLLDTHRLELEGICQQMDGRRRREISTVKMVLEREKESDMLALSDKLNMQYSQSMRDVEEKLQQQYSDMCGEVFAMERARLENEYKLCLDCFKDSAASEKERQFCSQLEQLCAHYRDGLEILRKKYEMFNEQKMSEVQRTASQSNDDGHVLSDHHHQPLGAAVLDHCLDPNAGTELDEPLHRGLRLEHFAETGQLKKSHYEEFCSPKGAYMSICEDLYEDAALPAEPDRPTGCQQGVDVLHMSFSSSLPDGEEVDSDVAQYKLVMEKKLRHCKNQLQAMSYNMRQLSVSHQQSIVQLKADFEQQRTLIVSEYELKLATFRSELQSLEWAFQQRHHQENQLLHRLHPKASSKVCCSQEVQTISENDKLIHHQPSLQEAHEQQCLGLQEAHEQQCLELQAKFAEEIEALKVAHNEDLSRTVSAINEEAMNMLTQQKDRLLKIHDLNLWVQESKMHSEFVLQLENIKSDIEERYIEALSELHVRSAIRHALMLETAESMKHGPEQGTEEELQMVLRQKCFEVEDIHSIAEMQVAKVREYESKLHEFKQAMSEEYASHIAQLRADHELDLAKQEQTLREQLEADYSKQLKVIADNYNAKTEFEIEKVKKDMNEAMEKASMLLSQQHMQKFRQMTEKLQEVHQAELAAADHERGILQAQHEEAISVVREELECKYQEDIACLTASHRQELSRLKERYEEEVVPVTKVREMESELAELRQQNAGLLGASSAQVQAQRSLQEALEAKQNELTALKELTDKEVTRIEQVLSEKIHEMEDNIQLKTTENASLLQAQNTLREEKLQLQSAFHQLTKDTELLQQSSVHMAESLRVADVELSECQGRYTRQLKEQQDTIAHMQHELDVARAERAVVETQLTSLHGVVTNSLQLVATLNLTSSSSMPHLQKEEHTTMEPHPGYMTPDNALTFSSKVDSGFASQQFSTLQGHFSVRDMSQYTPLVTYDNHQLSGEIYRAEPPSMGLAVEPALDKDGAPASHNLTVLPLDDTLCTSQYNLSLPHQPADVDRDFHGNDLSVYPLDQTHDPSVLSQPSDCQPNIQGDLVKLHCFIRDLIEHYVLAASEASKVHERLLSLEEQSSSDKRALTHQMSELQAKVQQMDGHLRDRQEQLAAAEAKIHELVDQVENGGSDLIEGVEDLLGAFKSNERTLGDLTKQLDETKRLLLKKDTDIQQLEEELVTVKADGVRQAQALDLEKEEWQKVRAGYEQELEHLASNGVLLKQECLALREANTELRAVKDKLELTVHTQDGRISQLMSDYTQQLQGKCDEITHLQDLPNQLAAKEEIVENLVAEKELLVSKLYAVEHEFAIYKSSGQGAEHTTTREASSSPALEEQMPEAQGLLDDLHSLQCKLTETEKACYAARYSEAQIREELVAMESDHKKALEGVQGKISLLNRQLEVCMSQIKTELNKFKELLQLTERGWSELAERRDQAMAKQLADMSRECEGMRKKNMALLHAASERDGELGRLVDHKTLLENNLAELVDEKRELEKRLQAEVALLEEQLAGVRRELLQQRARCELLQGDQTRWRDEISSLEATHRQEVQSAKVLHDQALALQSHAHTEEVASLRLEHAAVVRSMAEEYEQSLSQLGLEHAQDLERQRDELASRHAGEVALLKVQSREEPPLHPEDEQDTLDGTEPVAADDAYEDLSDEMLLSRIMELGPLLEAEAEAVRELCCLTGQPLPVEDVVEAPPTSLHSVIEQLQTMLQDLRNKMTASDIEDWRKELIVSVEKILQHEHSKMVAMTPSGAEPTSTEHSKDEDLVARYQRIFQEQISSYSTQLQQLHNAERESLVAEMRELQRSFDTMRSEQKEQINSLQLQLTQVKESSRVQNQELVNQLNEANSAHMHQLEEVLQLRAALESEGVKSARLQLLLNQAQLDHREVEAERVRLESSIQALHDELLDSRRNFSELEELASRAATTITTLDHEFKASRAREAELNKVVAELRTRHAMPGSDYYTRDDPPNSAELPEGAPTRESNGDVEDLHQRLQILQRELQAAREEVDSSQLALSIKQQEIGKLQANVEAQGADHQVKMDQFSQLFDKEHKANAALREAIKARDAELQALKLAMSAEPHVQGQRLPGVEGVNNKDQERAPNRGKRAVEADCNGSPSIRDEFEVKLGQLSLQYRQAELRRRSLLFQKKYLQCQLDAFYQTQQASLMMMADMGAPVDTQQLTRVHHQTSPHHRFRIAVLTVQSIVRIRLLQRKKVKYIRSKLEELRLKLSAPTGASPGVSLSPGVSSSVSSHSGHDPRLSDGHLLVPPTSKRHQLKAQKKH